MITAGDHFALVRQVELIFRIQKLGQIVSILIASYLAWIALQAHISIPGVAIWWIAAVSVAALRLILARRYSRLSAEEKEASIASWQRRIRFGALAGGVAWSGGTLLMTLGGDLVLQIFSAFVMAGMTAGALPVLGADRLAYRLYAWPIIVAVIVGVFGTDSLHMGFSILSFLALVIFTRGADVFGEMLNETFRLEFEKGDLLKHVDLARQVAERSDRAKTQFLANISHELRTPMNGILGLAEILGHDENLNSDQRESVRLLKESADEMMHHIEHLIELSALEAGHIQPRPAPFGVAELLGGLVSAQHRLAAAKGLKLEEYEDPALPPVLVGDLARLSQIFDHLVGNAIKFTETGSVSISARLLSRDNDTANVEFCVADTGPGMSRDKLQVINSMLAQGDSTLIRRHAGIGIGLPISRKLIELLGGKLAVESRVGIGSKFSFTLPFGLPKDEQLLIPAMSENYGS